MTQVSGFRQGTVLGATSALLASVTALGLAACSQSSGQARPTSNHTATASQSPTPGDSPFRGNRAWIAYQADRGTGERVWLVHPDGSADHQLQTGEASAYLLPDWSPDGSRLVYASRGGAGEPLYEYDLASRKTRQLFECTSPCVGDDEPAYSPDGKTIAFIRSIGPVVGDGPRDCGIWLGDRTTGRAHQLTSNTKPACDREYFVRWSPDGSHLVYQREIPSPGGEPETAVFTLDIKTKDQRRLTEPTMRAGEPAYSPDGKWIAFSTHPLNVFQTYGHSRLYRMRLDGSGQQPLTGTDIRATQPRYSPDGKWIVFTAVTPSSRHLWAIPAEGGAPIPIAEAEKIYTHGTWQPTP